jgi:thiol-disulfide isomerase/thioredoxin
MPPLWSLSSSSCALLIAVLLNARLSLEFADFGGGGGAGGSAVSLYDPIKDDIECLNKTNFDSVVYGSEKASFVEFYAHWCGTCQRYAKHWKGNGNVY